MVTTADKVPKIYGAMLKILTALDVLPKDKQTEQASGQRSYSYRGIDDLLNKLHPALVAAKVIILPSIVGEPILHYRDTRGLCFRAAIQVKYTFKSLEDGSEVVIGPVLGEGADGTDKGPGKAFAGAMKIAMFQAFAIPVAGGSYDAEDGEQDYPVDKDGNRIIPGKAYSGTQPQPGPIPPNRVPAPQTAASTDGIPNTDSAGNVLPEPAAAPAAQSAAPATNPPAGAPGHVKSVAELDELHRMLVVLAGGSEPIACQMLKERTTFQGTSKTGQPEIVFRDHFNGQYLKGPWLYKTLIKVREEYTEHLAKGGTPVP